MPRSSQADRILNTALEMAESSSWEAVQLYEVAEKLDISLDEIRKYYPQKDDLVEAWFDRADSTVLSADATTEYTELKPRERLHQVIMAWLLSMQAHRRVTRQMLCYKFEFGHIHLQVLGLLRVSRTVQWFREAALLKTANLGRIVEEVCITSIYLGSFARWLYDESENSEHTSRFLRHALKRVRTLD